MLQRLKFLEEKLGRILIAQTDLSPAGFVKDSEGQLIDAIALGSCVKKGQKVIAVRMICTVGLEVEHFLNDHEMDVMEMI